LRTNSTSADFAGIDPLDVVDRQVLLIALVELLDHRRNFEHPQRHSVEAEIARLLGFPGLADELGRTSGEAAAVKCYAELTIEGQNRSRVIAPRSYWRRPGVALRQELSRARKPLGRFIRRVARWRATIGLKTTQQ
jgi:hypothetical protein